MNECGRKARPAHWVWCSHWAGRAEPLADQSLEREVGFKGVLDKRGIGQVILDQFHLSGYRCQALVYILGSLTGQAHLNVVSGPVLA
jgi:hypothetical protein